MGSMSAIRWSQTGPRSNGPKQFWFNPVRLYAVHKSCFWWNDSPIQDDTKHMLQGYVFNFQVKRLPKKELDTVIRLPRSKQIFLLSPNWTHISIERFTSRPSYAQVHEFYNPVEPRHWCPKHRWPDLSAAPVPSVAKRLAQLHLWAKWAIRLRHGKVSTSSWGSSCHIFDRRPLLFAAIYQCWRCKKFFCLQ